MKKIGIRLFVVLVLLITAAPLAQAETNHRMANKMGVHLGLLGDPFPTLAGINLDYNVCSFARATAGYGSISATTVGGELKATTIGAGIRTFHPEWNFSPVVGLSWANVSVTSTGTLGTLTVGGFGASASHLYATFGLDWQAGSGFNFGAGYNLSLKSGVGGLPYINIGWFF
ncbi:MAG: hypothetical protein AABZ55_01015 [Bdellovibrionota bacterium]